MDFDSLYFNSYITSLLELDIEDIESSLPSSKEDGYMDFLKNAISYINKEIKSNEELKSESTDLEDISFIEKEIEKLEKVRLLLAEKLEITLDNNITIPVSNKHLIFLMTNASNPCIEKDLKDIPKEYAESLLDLFYRLESFGEDSANFNDILCKKLTGNKEFKDVFEMKNFKVRLFFMQLDKDTVLVIMAKIKNQNTSTYLDDALSSRLSIKYSSNETMIDKLKRDILNSELKDQMIIEHEKIKESILDKLKEKSK